jgi:HEAT repeat protein
MLKRNSKFINPVYFVTRSKLLILSGLLFCTPTLFPILVFPAHATEGLVKQDESQTPVIKPVLENCNNSQVEEYIHKLGTTELKDAEFEALIHCNSRAILALKTAANSSNSGVRAGAAYILGEIAVRNRNFDAIKIIEERRALENDLDVLKILSSYYADGPCGSVRNIFGFPRIFATSRYCDLPNIYKRAIQSQANISSPIICSLPGIRSIFPRCR